MSKWWMNTVIYEVYVDKFAKNFNGLTDKLDYLEELGIGCIWILPHYPSPMIDDGYDVSDFKNVRSDLGTLEDFRKFVKKAHSKNIKVMLDLVLNHVSSEHAWFQEAKQSKNNSKRDYFIWSETGEEFKDIPNPFFNVKPSNWIRNEETQDYYFSTFYPQQIDLNWQNPKIFKEITGVMDFWFDLGVDGFRLDAIKRLIKKEGSDSIGLPEMHDVLKKLRAHIDSNHKNKVLLAEAGHKNIDEALKYFGDGDECHMSYHFGLNLKTWVALKEEKYEELQDYIEETYKNLPKDCTWSVFLNNHDTINSNYVDENKKEELFNWLDPECKFSYKPGVMTSMRVAEVFEGNEDKIKNAFDILLSQPGAPVIYYGDEIGTRNEPVNPHPEDPRHFVRGEFDWNLAEQNINDETSIYNHLKNAIAKRNSNPPKRP